MAGADFVQAHATELSVGIGALRLALDTVRGVRSLLRRRRSGHPVDGGDGGPAPGVGTGERP
ncbi:hypothetical protein OG292_20380 [Streptomyces sp. NBC_01511]|uniref:hypothetical protein n=1 Tax=unclassified Streptomyces TaxID=2593676 RepID=UPI003866D9D8